MRDLIQTTGMVLYAAPVGEFDKRLILLTGDRGKITAFARGAKRTGSLLRAASRPFAFGTFTLSETRDAYNLYGAEIENYFEGLEQDVECACYASYFAEFAEYFGREGLEAREMLRLTLPVLPRPPKTRTPQQTCTAHLRIKNHGHQRRIHRRSTPARRRLRTLRLAVRHLRADREVVYISSVKKMHLHNLRRMWSGIRGRM